MATVYKIQSGEKSKASVEEEEEDGKPHSRKIKNKVLVLSSRGVTYRQRHLMADLEAMLPHSKKDAKLDTKSKLYHLNEVAELYSCNNILFFEARKRQDLYLWLARAPNGPSVKLHLQNLHTMDELNMTGNALKGSRPILSFDKSFDGQPYTRLLKEMLQATFGVPKGARRSKPFTDHVLTFTLADGKIWFRNFQIVEKESDDPKVKRRGGAADTSELSLLEIGPRFVMTVICVLEGSFGGPVIYENKEFVSPNQVRASLKAQKASKYRNRAESKAKTQVKKRVNHLPADEMADEMVFADMSDEE
ncbi:Ribosome bioproteinsis protein brx1 [Saitoella coloradoensis]